MSEQNLQISIIEIKDMSSVVININDVSSVIINIQNRVKKYNINDNIILSKNQLTKYRLNKRLDKYQKYMYENPDVLKCICYSVMLTICILIFIEIKKS